MSWLKVDDGFPSHEKVMALSEGPCRGDAIALWVFAGCWTSHALREGFVPNGVIRAYGFHLEAASELVRVGLWVAAEGGYRFHDWADYQPSAAQVEERRRAGAERKARSRARLSAAQSNARVGESQRDGGIVTGVPRTESRPCLADASRDRERASENSSSAEHKNSYPDTAHAILNFRQPLGDPPPNLPPAEKPPLEQILSAHAARFSKLRNGETCKRDYTAAKTVLAWCEENASVHKAASGLELALRVVAGLFESERAAGARWKLSWAANDPAEFLPPPPGVKPVAAVSSKEAAQAQKQAAADNRADEVRKDFNARIKKAREAGDSYTAEILAAERDQVCAHIRAKAS